MRVFVGAIALQHRKAKGSTSKETWNEQVKRSAELLKEKLGKEFDEEEFVTYAKKGG